MICKKCAAAADKGESPKGHCNRHNTWCDCQHRPIGSALSRQTGTEK